MICYDASRPKQSEKTLDCLRYTGDLFALGCVANLGQIGFGCYNGRNIRTTRPRRNEFLRYRAFRRVSFGHGKQSSNDLWCPKDTQPQVLQRRNSFRREGCPNFATHPEGTERKGRGSRVLKTPGNRFGYLIQAADAPDCGDALRKKGFYAGGNRAVQGPVHDIAVDAVLPD